jgi:hypothetical protein
MLRWVKIREKKIEERDLALHSDSRWHWGLQGI